MVTSPAQTHPKFTDTYWIIPLDSNTPYGKVSFTYRDFRTSADNCVDFIKNPLPVYGNFGYSDSALNKSNVGFGSLNTKADIDRFKVRFFYVRNQRCAPIMVGRSGEASAPAGFFGSSLPTPLRLATPFGSGLVRLQNLTKEAATMVATTPTRPEFIDTYWIIPEYTAKPSGDFTDNNPDLIKNPLPVLANFAYSDHALVNPSDRFGTLNWYKATIDAEDSVFFYVVDNASQYSMVALLGQSSDWLVSLYASSSNPDNVTAHKEIGTSSGDFLNKYKEIASMATIPSQTHPKFTDTYWVIRLDSNLPYGKVSFTHRDFRTFTALFKDSRLIWAGRKPVHAGMGGN